MNLSRQDPMTNQARYLRMLLVDAFITAPTWSDMVVVGEAMAKLNRLEREHHAEWLHLNPEPNASQGCSQNTSKAGTP